MHTHRHTAIGQSCSGSSSVRHEHIPLTDVVTFVINLSRNIDINAVEMLDHDNNAVDKIHIHQDKVNVGTPVMHSK